MADETSAARSMRAASGAATGAVASLTEARGMSVVARYKAVLFGPNAEPAGGPSYSEARKFGKGLMPHFRGKKYGAKELLEPGDANSSARVYPLFPPYGWTSVTDLGEVRGVGAARGVVVVARGVVVVARGGSSSSSRAPGALSAAPHARPPISSGSESASTSRPCATSSAASCSSASSRATR